MIIINWIISFNKKYSKTNNIVKYDYNLKQLFSVLIYLM